MGLVELKKYWEELLADEGMPSNVDQIGKRARIHNGRPVPVVRFREGMTVDLPPWPDQGTSADIAASPNPTAEAAEANLDNV